MMKNKASGILKEIEEIRKLLGQNSDNDEEQGFRYT